jgi:hypothetical protein
MKGFNKIAVLGVLSVIICGGFTTLFAEADPFYTKVFEEGKTYFVAGNFHEAEVNFRIAEFGLLDEREMLKEVYPYYSLALFQLGRLEETRKIIKRFENGLIVKDLNTITTSPAIKVPFKAMLAALLQIKKTGNGNSRGKIYSFELLYLQVLQQLENDELKTVSNSIVKLENIDKKDPRVYYLRGILKFKQKNYKACVKALRAFEKVKSTSVETSLLTDNLYYHLCLSYHYLNNTKKTAHYYNKVTNLARKSGLYQKIAADQNDKEEKKAN